MRSVWLVASGCVHGSRPLRGLACLCASCFPAFGPGCFRGAHGSSHAARCGKEAHLLLFQLNVMPPIHVPSAMHVERPGERVATFSKTQCAAARIAARFRGRHLHPACSGESDISTVGIMVRHGLRSLTVDRSADTLVQPLEGSATSKVCKVSSSFVCHTFMRANLCHCAACGLIWCQLRQPVATAHKP